MTRIGTLQVGNPYKLSLEHFILGSFEGIKELNGKRNTGTDK